MDRRRTYRAACAALVVPLILLVGLRSAWALYTCKLDGVVRSACCCEGVHKRVRERGPVRDAHVAAASCCAIEIQAQTRAPEAQTPARADDHAAPIAIASPAAPALAPPAPIVARADRSFERPPPIATFLHKQAFLR